MPEDNKTAVSLEIEDLAIPGEVRTLSRSGGSWVPIWAFEEATLITRQIEYVGRGSIHGEVAEALARARLRGRKEIEPR